MLIKDIKNLKNNSTSYYVPYNYEWYFANELTVEEKNDICFDSLNETLNKLNSTLFGKSTMWVDKWCNWYNDGYYDYKNVFDK